MRPFKRGLRQLFSDLQNLKLCYGAMRFLSMPTVLTPASNNRGPQLSSQGCEGFFLDLEVSLEDALVPEREFREQVELGYITLEGQQDDKRLGKSLFCVVCPFLYDIIVYLTSLLLNIGLAWLDALSWLAESREWIDSFSG